MLDRLLRTTTAPAWFFLLLFLVYAVTAHYGGHVVNDVHSAAHAAWSLATRGTLDLSGLQLPYEQTWTVRVGDEVFSNRFPGVILSAVPLYWLVHPAQPTVGPGALTAALSSAVGVSAVLLGLRQQQVPLRWAWASASLLGFGTAVWSVAADGLWTHGVTTMWLGLVYAGTVLGGRWRGVVVLAAAGAVLTRPHLAVALVLVALLLARPRPGRAIPVVIGVALGTGAYLLYGRMVLGEWSLTGAYDADVLSPTRIGVPDPQGENPALWRLENLTMAFVAVRVGLLPCYPGLAPALWAARRFRRAPREMIGLAAGGLAYFVVSVLINRVSGGSGFWGNRTLLESVVLCWPLLTWSVASHRGGLLWRGLLSAGIAWSVFFHGLGAVTSSPAPDRDGSIMFWQVPAGLLQVPVAGVAIMFVLAAFSAWAAWRLSQMEPAEAPQPASTSASTEPATSTSASSTSR